MKTKSKRLKLFVWLLLSAGLLAIGSTVFVVNRINIPPRQLSPYIEHRAEGHNQHLVDFADWTSRTLQKLDRGTPVPHTLQSWTIGAQNRGQQQASNPSATVMVSTLSEFQHALSAALPGQVIVILPGHYRIDGDSTLEINRAGTEAAPITVRAERPGSVFIELNAGEGFHVAAPYWTFENLTIRGVCTQQTFCQHAFHVVGKGTHFTARNNTIIDFNAHFKINAEDGDFPDYGLIDGNTLTNSTARQTDSPVTPIDLVTASHWRISHNLITDFIKAEGDHISYGAYVKGGGSDNRIEQNIVLCEYLLHDNPGQQVGLSIGGGGTGPQYCRDQRCITEQDGGVIQSNLIASCSDDGIYLNRAASSKIRHNTLVDTGGISVRFPESTADVEGNLIDGVVRTRDDGLLRTADNLVTSSLQLYLGWHPVRDLFINASALNFRWKNKPPVRDTVDEVIPDLCGKQHPKQASYGAFEDFSNCAKT
jgi:parallel beta-helix repeat protein